MESVKLHLRKLRAFRSVLGEGRTKPLENGNRVSGLVSPSAGGDPILDAIYGNEIWGVEGVPGEKSLKVCSDGGNELHFQTAEPDRVLGQEQMSMLLHAGAHLTLDDSTMPQATENLEVDDTSEARAKLTLKEVDSKLRSKSKVPFGGKGYYIPISSLEAIMTYETIKAILPYIAKGLAPNKLDSLAGIIFGVRVDSQSPPISFRKILSVLILIGKADSIVDFVQALISDNRLPLQKLGEGREFQLCLDGSNEPLRCFTRWESRDIENFEDRQWETLAPFFSRGTEIDNWVRHYELLMQRPLPFEIMPTSEDRGDGTQNIGNIRPVLDLVSSESIDGMRGAHGIVKKVKIDPAHHNLPSHTGVGENPPIGIKQLFSPDKVVFKNEVKILTRLNKCKDPHLVKLLLTMEIIGPSDSAFYLMFPLADSNLRQFWDRTDPYPKDVLESPYPQWVAMQCRGLARALCKLHDLHEREAVASVASDPFYGIHGDIKPENLLWYKVWEGYNERSHGWGVIQLADFGISSIHHTETRSNVNLRKATKTYAPPENELGLDGSRSFDIWGLGCVFLEFLCWLARGSTENPVNAFRNARLLDRDNKSLEGAVQDTFYHIKKGNGKVEFVVNPAVIRLIKDLHKRPTCSDFVHDFLDIILHSMLVVEKKKGSQVEQEVVKPKESTPENKRITCVELAKKLDALVNKGETNPDYFSGSGGRKSPKLRRDRPEQYIRVNESPERLVKMRQNSIRSLSAHSTLIKPEMSEKAFRGSPLTIQEDA